MFQVRAFTEYKGWGAWGEILRTRTGRSAPIHGPGDEINRTPSASPSTTVIILVMVGILGLFMVIMAVIYLRRKRNSGCHKKQPSDLDALEYDKNNGECE